MAETLCPTLSADPAVQFASGGYDTFMDLAPSTFNQALELANKLNQILIEPVQFNANFDFDGQLTPFQRPTRPTIDASKFTFTTPAGPGDAPTYSGGDVLLDAMPVYNLADPTVRNFTPPTTPVVTAPTPPNKQKELVVPDAPAYTLPALPSFIDLNLPKAPSITLPEFEGVRPSFVEPPFNENWSFTATPYTSALMDQIRGKVSSMMDADTGLEPIETAMFGRGLDRIEIENRRAIDTRTAEFSARGFSEPHGVLVASIDEIIQTGQNNKAQLSREIAIATYQESLVNLRFAVQQGLALEQLATNLHIQEQQLALSAAQYLRDSALAVLNARISVFNAKLQAYQTDAQVLAARIQAELAKVEVYRAQLEGEKTKNEINLQRVQMYGEQIRALSVMADFYRAQIAGVQAEADVQRNVIEKFKAEVDAYSARWRAYGDEVNAYRAQIDAENSAVSIHRNLVDAYATRVQAANNVNRGRLDAEQLRISQNGQQIAVFRAKLDRMLGLIQAESARIDGEARRAGAVAQIYTADAGVETAASAAADRSLQIGLDRERARVDTSLEEARIKVQENQQLTSLNLEAIKTQATVLAQLAASALSSMNFSASVSSSRSESKSCSTSFSWSGEIADYE